METGNDKQNTQHKKGCTWGDSDCSFKDTHHYCPHPEHKSTECKCFTGIEQCTKFLNLKVDIKATGAE